MKYKILSTMLTSHKSYKTHTTYRSHKSYKSHLLYLLPYILYFPLFFSSCTSVPSQVPSTFTETADSLVIYPDYRDVTIPPNIAPLNFMITDAEASEYVATVGDLVCGAAEDGKIDMDTTAWRQVLAEARGKDLAVSVYAHRPAGWVRYSPFSLHVAEEEIDPFLSYRLIEPGYELYRQLGLYQRNLTNFNEYPIYENNRSYDDNENHCINCHNYQNYDTERMLFHVRASHGGTVITNGTEGHKIAIKHDSILAAGVYPSWHPTLPLVAFSTNKTGQVFHMQHPEKIEVLDVASDLIIYDAEHNTVRNVLRTSDEFETFPCWAPDGRRLYYCSAKRPHLLGDEVDKELPARYDSLLYDIYSMPFDPETLQFGEPRLEIDVSHQGKSISVPRVSPDGRYLLYTLGDYGQFHIWHKSADLWVAPFNPSAGDERSLLAPYPLTAANSPAPESYHTWSSNGRWIVFASRRDDGDYSRPYIAYFDTTGQARRAFLMPQRDPEQNIFLLKSYNVPELTRHAVRIPVAQFNHIVRQTDAEVAKFIP